MTVMRTMMATLKLTVNETKTRLCRVPDESFDFLGYTIGRFYSPKTGASHIGVRPSDKKIRRLCLEIREQTKRGRWNWFEPEEMAGHLNRMMVGWANYFCLGWVSKAYQAVTVHARHRLRQWLMGTQKVQGSIWARYNDHHLHEDLGLIDLARCRHRFSWAKA